MASQRSLSLRRRDGSWDRRWEATQRGEGGERSGQSRPWARPGKLNNSYWENRVKSEEAVPARTPPPRRRLVTLASPDPTRYHPTTSTTSQLRVRTIFIPSITSGGETVPPRVFSRRS